MDLKKELDSIKGNTITRKNANALFDRYIKENVGTALDMVKEVIKARGKF